jgi:hypothetical protein
LCIRGEKKEWYICGVKNRVMGTVQIIQEIQKLSIDKKFHVVEETIKAIKQEETSNQMDLAVKLLYNDYTSDKELTAFTALDLQEFYEAR